MIDKIDKIKKMLRRESESEKCALASDPRTPRSKLLKLANSNSISVKIRIAHRLDIDSEIIEVLISDENFNVRYALINKEDCGNVPSTYLEKLTEDPVEFISKKAKEIIVERTQEGIYSFSFFLPNKKIRSTGADSELMPVNNGYDLYCYFFN